MPSGGSITSNLGSSVEEENEPDGIAGIGVRSFHGHARSSRGHLVHRSGLQVPVKRDEAAAYTAAVRSRPRQRKCERQGRKRPWIATADPEHGPRLGKDEQEEAETLRRVHRLPEEGQLRPVRSVPQRQKPPDLQGQEVRKADGKEAEKGKDRVSEVMDVSLVDKVTNLTCFSSSIGNQWYRTHICNFTYLGPTSSS